jgi:hypothetical protein
MAAGIECSGEMLADTRAATLWSWSLGSLHTRAHQTRHLGAFTSELDSDRIPRSRQHMHKVTACPLSHMMETTLEWYSPLACA